MRTDYVQSVSLIYLLWFSLSEELGNLSPLSRDTVLFLFLLASYHLLHIKAPGFLLRTKLLFSSSISESTGDIPRIHWKKIPSRCDNLDSSLASKYLGKLLFSLPSYKTSFRTPSLLSVTGSTHSNVWPSTEYCAVTLLRKRPEFHLGTNLN